MKCQMKEVPLRLLDLYFALEGLNQHTFMLESSDVRGAMMTVNRGAVFFVVPSLKRL